jgi:hypothetical protein
MHSLVAFKVDRERPWTAALTSRPAKTENLLVGDGIALR